ncbi:MAG TPA: hypothetical protein VLL48_13245, partial [Longimicrobiales bacterium]|nr:hypothetical protein [Longimicrobiales bacterium]
MTLLDLLPVRLATDTAVAVLLEGSLLLGATWVAAALLRRHSPAARHGVWTLGFVLALIVPLAGTALPERSLGLLPYPTSSRADAGAGDAPIRTGNGAGLRAARPFPGLPDAGDVPGLERAALTPPPPEPGRADRIGASLATGFWLLWGAGALALVLRLGGHRIRVGRLTARGAPVPAGDLPARIARREAARMGIRRRVRVVYTDELPVPVTWGVVRPRLLLPPDAASWSETRLRAV